MHDAQTLNKPLVHTLQIIPALSDCDSKRCQQSLLPAAPSKRKTNKPSYQTNTKRLMCKDLKIKYSEFKFIVYLHLL